MLGSSFPQHNNVGPMPKTKALLQDKGAMALNFFIHTPICCPSRSELLTGMYFHNIKSPANRPGQPRNGSCMHTDDLKVQESVFAKYLGGAGYTAGMFGKYLNSWDFTVVPKGFDCPTCAWMANGGGNYYSPAFVTKNAGAGIPDCLGGHPGGQLDASTNAACAPAGDFQFPMENYTTSVVGNVSIEWIRKVVKGTAGPSPPFFAYVAPKAAHEPFNPAPWYRDHWDDSWPSTEPRPVSWNCSAESRKDHHGQ